jgi:hypothetical protein
MIEAVGWIATAVFVASYFPTRSHQTRLLQMCGAVIWTGYGLAIGASPVVVANVLVFSSAAWATWRKRERRAAAGSL